MGSELKRIEYRHGTLSIGMRPSELPMRVWSGTDISLELHQSIQEQGILSLGGQYGKQIFGLPLQYDEVRIFTNDNVIDIVLYNRDTSLSPASDPKIARIAKVLRALSKSEAD